MAPVGLVLGIVAVLVAIFINGLIGLILALLAGSFSLSGLRKAKRDMDKTDAILAAIGLGCGIVVALLVIIAMVVVAVRQL